MEKLRIIVSGGGTGGHIFPAVSIANELRRQLKGDINILFVGASGRMEMERVPKEGYEIVGLPVQGFIRKPTPKNFIVLWNLWKSIKKAKEVVSEFKPHAVVGVGGYASGPLARVAAKQGVPIVLQEQNSYAGVTNKLLSKLATKICVAYEGMERFFPADKLILTGNPVRQNIVDSDIKKSEAKAFFNLKANAKVILSVGGSLGARTINESIEAKLPEIAKSKVQLIWQTGKHFKKQADVAVKASGATNVYVTDFISRMDMAYTAANLVISRAGASTISELCLIGKPTILVPSPNVAEDHQTKNAQALEKNGAAVMVRDIDAKVELIDKALTLVEDTPALHALSTNVLKMALPHSAKIIADEVLKIAAGIRNNRVKPKKKKNNNQRCGTHAH